MAEAHQGVAFAFIVTEEEGLHLSVSYEMVKAILMSGLRSWRRMFKRLSNQILNGLYPSHPFRGVVVIAVTVGLRKYRQIDLSFGVADLIQEKIPKTWFTPDRSQLVASALFGGATWLTLVSVRKLALQKLFSYHGWMYDSRKTITIKSKIWGLLTKLLIGHNPRLYSYQNLLPYLPVPDLKDTIRRYLRTVRPLLDDESYAKIEKSALEFQNGIGRRLQRYLIFKSYISSNYVSDWWEEYVYLRGRSPIMVNSNFYGTELLNPPLSNVQIARAANAIVAAFDFRRLLEKEAIRPLLVQDMVPICSRQHERQFNTVRVPGEVTDKIVHFGDSKHIAVYCKGKWFKLYTYHQNKSLNPKEIELQLQRIVNDKSVPSEAEKHLGALTAGDRIPWAQARQKYFSRGINARSLAAIEKAAFVVCLDDESYEFTIEDNKDLDAYAKNLLHGRGYDRWFDKSFSLIVSKNARIGLNCEHAWADAPVSAFMWEYIISDDYGKFGYDSQGNARGTIRYNNLPEPTKLKWELESEVEGVIMSSFKVAHELLSDIDLHLYIHRDFGKDFIKSCNLSPDAFLQMALQLAYYRDIGRHHLTYEASMTRLFREGRTETVRSCSIESAAWVKSMVNPNATNEERLKLLKKACDYHVEQYKNSMTGKGVDRHIFCLYVVSRYLEVDTPFLKEVLSEPWRLSTSQIPHNQTNKLDKKCVSAGGGFGPVADDGYGVSYNVSSDTILSFHISSRKSSDKTDSHRFAGSIRQALLDIQSLFTKQQQDKK